MKLVAQLIGATMMAFGLICILVAGTHWDARRVGQCLTTGGVGIALATVGWRLVENP